MFGFDGDGKREARTGSFYYLMYSALLIWKLLLMCTLLLVNMHITNMKMFVFVYGAENMSFSGYTNTDNETLCILLTWKCLFMGLCAGVRILLQP